MHRYSRKRISQQALTVQYLHVQRAGTKNFTNALPQSYVYRYSYKGVIKRDERRIEVQHQKQATQTLLLYDSQCKAFTCGRGAEMNVQVCVCVCVVCGPVVVGGVCVCGGGLGPTIQLPQRGTCK